LHGWNQHEITGDLANNFGLNYDREKYKDMLLDASETVLGYSDSTGHYLAKQMTGPGGLRLEGTG
jgi:hypothetical protein